MDNQTKEELIQLLYSIADDQLIIGHRNSEWTGLGPILEEDIAFSSIAQDKIGHSLGIYSILHNELGEKDPDSIAFLRDEKDMKCCHLVEYPIGEYDFSLVRHFYFDMAELIRFEMLASSEYIPLAKLSKKIKSEIKYHIFHAITWLKQLAEGTEDSKNRIQTQLNELFPYAVAMFEPLKEENLVKHSFYPGKEVLKAEWLKQITAIIEENGYTMPTNSNSTIGFGGRNGNHTEYLQPLLNEMSEVIKIDPSAEW